jgi:hypothetical protein
VGLDPGRQPGRDDERVEQEQDQGPAQPRPTRPRRVRARSGRGNRLHHPPVPATPDHTTPVIACPSPVWRAPRVAEFQVAVGFGILGLTSLIHSLLFLVALAIGIFVSWLGASAHPRIAYSE